VNEDSVQYVTRKQGRVRARTPRGWKKEGHVQPHQDDGTDDHPEEGPPAYKRTSQLLSIGRPLMLALDKPKPKYLLELGGAAAQARVCQKSVRPVRPVSPGRGSDRAPAR